MASIVDPPPDGKTEFGPGHPYWPCPLCAGLRPSSVSPLIRAKHIEHTEEFCPDCFAGMESSEHHEKCVVQRDDCDDYCMVPFGTHHPRCGVRR